MTDCVPDAQAAKYHNQKNWRLTMDEKLIMYCYSGKNWESTPLKDRGVYDITNWTAEETAEVADLQQEFMGRKIHIKREKIDDFHATWDDGSEM
jgi:hypothetical protein